MKVIDELYGEFILEDIFIDLLNTKEIKRLKGVHQGGAGYLINKSWNVNRYEHSLGVMLLVKKLGGQKEEQIAALLHDISHTTFSHVIDYVFNNENEDIHELIYKYVIENSEISNILNKDGYLYKELLLDNREYSLLERKAPHLCADRIDYTLRDMYRHGNITSFEVDNFINSLRVKNGIIYINDIDQAEWFVELYYKEVIDYFLNPLNVYINDIIKRILKYTIKNKIVRLEQLLTTDDEIMECFKESNDSYVQSLLNEISNNKSLKSSFKDDYDIFHRNKLRIIDPLVQSEAGLLKASKLSPKVHQKNKEAKYRAEKGIYIKVKN
ncbi:HD domain-containing protein [Bacillus xiamenensis]|uniref:HD domain-containing protein n=1 Tax=Bacillus xiamenensis TaxID=1178537 RepID=UPI00028EA27D|nr:HD domain-containing protein [Bacillus xiamenensis]EKF36473.1 metal-dependent phosphohydrolase [Bacillus xiamenensis]MCW1837947.1 HD domain-containing protein [Bacillus xiamenensis]